MHQSRFEACEVLDRRQVTSEANRTRRASGPPQETRFQQHGIPGKHGIENVGDGGNLRRSVTQSCGAGFGRCPNLPTPSRGNDQARNQGHKLLEGDGLSSNPCDKPKRGGGGPTRRSRHGSSNTGDTSRDGFLNARRHRVDNNFHGSRGRRKSVPPHSSSPESLEDRDSEFAVVDDEDRQRHREKKERNPRTGRDQEQPRQIQERIVEDGCRKDNEIFVRRLDRLPMYLQGVASERVPEQQRSVTQQHKVGTGQCPNPSTPLQGGLQANSQGRQPSGGSSSSSSDGLRRGEGPNGQSRQGSNRMGDSSHDRSSWLEECRNNERRTQRWRQKVSPLSSSSSSLSEDWVSEFTVLLGDEGVGSSRSERHRIKHFGLNYMNLKWRTLSRRWSAPASKGKVAIRMIPPVPANCEIAHR